MHLKDMKRYWGKNNSSYRLEEKVYDWKFMYLKDMKRYWGKNDSSCGLDEKKRNQSELYISDTLSLLCIRPMNHLYTFNLCTKCIYIIYVHA